MKEIIAKQVESNIIINPLAVMLNYKIKKIYLNHHDLPNQYSPMLHNTY